MFYLLEDNRIIDSEKYINSILNKGKNSEKNYEYLYEIRNGQSYYYGKIKKQSEDVFDLIEVGDLIASYRYPSKDEADGVDINNVDRVEKDCVVIIAVVCLAVDFEYILAIYKPDANGNYIKVWEKKEDEKED